MKQRNKPKVFIDYTLLGKGKTLKQRNIPKLLTDYRECKYCRKNNHQNKMLYITKKWFCNTEHYRIYASRR